MVAPVFSLGSLMVVLGVAVWRWKEGMGDGRNVRRRGWVGVGWRLFWIYGESGVE